MPKFHLSLRDRIIIGAIILLTLLIPTGAYVLSLRFNAQSQASDDYSSPVTSPKSEATTSSKLKDALDRLNQTTSGGTSGSTAGTQTTTETGSDDTSSSQLILGPTLGFSLILQARPLDNQSTKAFLGIALGQPTTKPTYLLSFMVDIPASGSFDGISLSGLESGSTYTAYIKGASQIATASAFVVKATPSNLAALNLLTGDVNEDNVIDILDYNLVKATIGGNPTSAKWNALYDFNLDNVINSWDLNIVLSNLGKIGASGAWYSYSPIATASATTSALLTSPSTGSVSGEMTTGTQESEKSGYWMWVPEAI